MPHPPLDSKNQTFTSCGQMPLLWYTIPLSCPQSVLPRTIPHRTRASFSAQTFRHLREDRTLIETRGTCIHTPNTSSAKRVCTDTHLLSLPLPLHILDSRDLCTGYPAASTVYALGISLFIWIFMTAQRGMFYRFYLS